MKKTKLLLRSIVVMGRRAPVYLLAILGMSISFAMFSVVGSILMKSVVDMALVGDQAELLLMVLVITCGGFFSLLIYGFCTITYNVEAKKIYGKLSGEVLETELHLPYQYFEEHHSGELISQVTYDLNGMGAIYGSRFRRVVMPILEVVVLLIPMLIYCWQLTLCMVAVNCAIIFLDIATVSTIHKIKKHLSSINKKMTEHLSDMLQGIVTIRMFQAGNIKRNKIDACNKEYYQGNKAYIGISAIIESITIGCDLLCGLLFVILAILLVNKGVVTLGAIAGIYTIYGSFTKQFLMIGKYIPELSACLANADNIFNFLDNEREPDYWYFQNVSMNISKSDDALRVENVSFGYNKGQYILKNISFNVAANECVAITGPSGCVKTTFAKLMLGLYPIEKGNIVINGKSIRNMSLSETRENIAYVPQDAYLFFGTIKDNIRYGLKNATDKEIEEAAYLANAHDFIVQFDMGYNTIINEGGGNLSGGQRQRIAIARAIISGAPIIILDEATSALDSDSENKVNQALKNIQGKRTIIMIAHRPSTIQMADRVIRI